MTDIVDRARQALRGITPGPWEVGESNARCLCVWSPEDDLIAGGHTDQEGVTEETIEFIAAAPQFVGTFTGVAYSAIAEFFAGL